MTRYLVDSNIFINLKNNYKREFFPLVWSFFEENPNIFILDKVYDEILKVNDELNQWAKHNQNKILPSDTSINEYRQVVEYLQNCGNWTEAGYEQWIFDSRKAVPWLIATAKAQGLTVVTNERYKGPNGRASDNEPKIPFVAGDLGVPTIDFWELLRQEQFSEVRESSH